MAGAEPTTPILRSCRLTYEVLSAAHAPELLEALSDPRVNRYFPQPEAATLPEMERQVRLLCAGPKDGAGQWWNFVVRLDGGGLIGRLEATLADGSAEIAFLFHPDAWGFGYASEAVHWLTGYCRTRLGIGSFWAAVHPDNTRSARLLLRLGFRDCGTGGDVRWPGYLIFRSD